MSILACYLFEEILDPTHMSKATMNNSHSRHFQLFAAGIQVQIFPNPHRTHTFQPHSLHVGAVGPWTHVHANIQTIVAAVSRGQLLLSLPCSLTAHIKYTKDKMSISASAGWWWWRAALSTKKPNKSTSLLSWTEYTILQQAGCCCCHVLCSFTIKA